MIETAFKVKFVSGSDDDRDRWIPVLTEMDDAAGWTYHLTYPGLAEALAGGLRWDQLWAATDTTGNSLLKVGVTSMSVLGVRGDKRVDRLFVRERSGKQREYFSVLDMPMLIWRLR